MADDSEFSFNGPDTFREAVIMLLIGLLATGYGAYDYVQQFEALTNAEEVPTTISPTYDTESEARSVLDGYETGDTVTAYVPPSNPDNAYLNHQSSNAPLLVVGIGLFFVIGGGVSTLKRY